MRGFISDIWRGTRKYFGIALFILLAGVIVGMLNSASLSTILEKMIEQVREVSQGLQLENNIFATIRVIFMNNLMAAIMMLGMGTFFAIFPIWGLFMNGAVLGYILTMPNPKGLSTWEILVYGILPHGVIEIVAILFAAGVGIRFGVLSFRSIGALFAPQKRDRVKRDWGDSLRILWKTFILIVVMLFVAAVIESVITPQLLNPLVK
ncbi:stage II sporulation protein M [Brevibacillus sp. 7WMA2]|uniref:stage II sporulation protein M n=1 Tax=Brevibacillus sp. 7WMA2 TaxID=2683193 RepID=UPI0013A762A9|nr:stage II sporulation protein M [Brevibacillus sp. 7WMA2]QIC07160.1 stage II sporulation protein M [Brevibacillus sp. 7WMA2]